MIKAALFTVFLAAAAVIWIRSKWARSKNSDTAKQIIKNLQSGETTIESYEDSLNIHIATKNLSTEIDFSKTKIHMLSQLKAMLPGKFIIGYADLNSKGKGIILAEALMKDSIPGYSHDKEIDIHFPCWLYMDIKNDEKQIVFKSIFPESKDHHYLLEDLSEIVFHIINKQ